MGEPLRFVGVDLAAQAANTAVALISLQDDRLAVQQIISPASDDDILTAAEGSAKAGIDAPLGWPDRFVEYLTEHRNGTQSDMGSGSPGVWLDERTYRVTDLRLRADKTPPLRRISPLSAAADKLGRTTLRCAGLQARMAQAWGPDTVRRDGSGRIVEVYPAASLAVWGMPQPGVQEAGRAGPP